MGNSRKSYGFSKRITITEKINFHTKHGAIVTLIVAPLFFYLTEGK